MQTAVKPHARTIHETPRVLLGTLAVPGLACPRAAEQSNRPSVFVHAPGQTQPHIQVTFTSTSIHPLDTYEGLPRISTVSFIGVTGHFTHSINNNK